MRIPSASASNQNLFPSLGQRQPKTSPTGYTTTPTASAGTDQQPTAASGSGQALNTNSSVQISLAMLLSSQGATIVPANFQLSPYSSLSQSSTATVSFTGTSGSDAPSGPPTAASEAMQIMDSLGSNGVLSLANVQSAENGCTTAPLRDLINSNTDADIASDFTKLSGGGSTMTLAQLTSAIQGNANPQNQPSNSYGKVVMPGALTATSTTNGVPNSTSAPASSTAGAVALEYLWLQQRLTDASGSTT